jgi:Polyketide cyclase / dehydrase and lipid transport
MRKIGVAAFVTGLGAVWYRLVVTGQVTLDTGIGRRVRPLGPLTIAIAADPETVFDVIAAPYLGRTPRALRGEIEVLERSGEMVLAAHRTPVAGGLVTTTVETVRFERPGTVAFRLVRGPVPYVMERFTPSTEAGSTRLEYTGELGTDFWAPGRVWGDVVARNWVATVQTSLERVRTEAERKAAHGRGG